MRDLNISLKFKLKFNSSIVPQHLKCSLAKCGDWLVLDKRTSLVYGSAVVLGTLHRYSPEGLLHTPAILCPAEPKKGSSGSSGPNKVHFNVGGLRKAGPH